MLSQVVDYYHATLLDSPEALAYLARRKIDDPEVIARFRLGYANRTLGYRLPTSGPKAGTHVRGRLQRLGVLPAVGPRALAGSLVVPVIDPYRHRHRALRAQAPRHLRAGTPAHLYLPGPHRGVWNEEGLAGGEVIVASR